MAKLKASIAPSLDLIDLLMQLESLEVQLATKRVSTETLACAKDLQSGVGRVSDLFLSQKTTLTRLDDAVPMLQDLAQQQASGLGALDTTLQSAVFSIQNLEVNLSG